MRGAPGSDGRSNSARYIAWYDAWLASKYLELKGSDMYALRSECSTKARWDLMA